MQMERRDTNVENAPTPITFKYDTATNVTFEREENPRKGPFPIDLSDEETENDLRPPLAISFNVVVAGTDRAVANKRIRHRPRRVIAGRVLRWQMGTES
jgi:hypothetical protein